MLLVWDALFRTRVWRVGLEAPLDTGLGTQPDFPQGYLGQLAAPFEARRWRS